MVSRGVTINWGPQEMCGDTCGCPDQENLARGGWRAECCSVPNRDQDASQRATYASVLERLTFPL